MANAIYPKWKQAVMGHAANSSLLGGNLKAMIVDADAYVYSAAHEFLSSVPVGARISISAVMGGVSVADGVLDANDALFTAVVGPVSEVVAIILDTGDPATTRLVAYLDTSYTNLPVTPVGGNIQIVWDDGANKIFKL